MNDYEYSVIVDNVVIAKGMTLGNATILVKALFQEWYNEDHMSICIQKYPTGQVCDGKGE